MSSDPRKILLVKPTALGDVVQALPVAGLLKRRWPGASIAWVVSRPFAALLEAHPHVDEVIGFDRRRGARWATQLSGARRLARDLRRDGFDLTIDLQGLFRSGWLTWASGAGRRVGFAYARERAAAFYTDRVAARPGPRNAAERYLDVAEHLGCGRSPVDAAITTTPGDEAVVDALLQPLNGRPFAALLPGTNWATKRWPAGRFADLARRLETDGLATVVAGAPDAAEASAVIGGVDVVGRTNVRELAALMRRAALVVANDSGPMHLAAALHRPLVALFGPTDPRLTGPHGSPGSVVRLDVPCHPCLSRQCVHQTCLVGLSVDAVAQRCLATLGGR